jgi:tRNA nucleotidyltransferase (CCA-adding enzyme)
MTQRPDVFFDVLRSTNALKVVFPELDRLFGVPQPERWHPEIDTGAHLLLTLKVAAQLSDDLETRFAVLTHDLGKGTTPKETLPKHRGHEQRSVELIGDFCARFPVPTKLRQLADLVAAHHGSVHRANEMRPGSVFDLVIKLDGIRQPDRLEKILIACEADARGRLGLEHSEYPQAAIIKLAAKTAAAVQRETIPGIDQLEGAAIGTAIRDAQRRAVTRALTEVQAPP